MRAPARRCGATGLPAPSPRRAPPRARRGRIEIAVVGAHLSGLPLNRELVDSARRSRAKSRRRRTTACSRSPGTTPPKPGLLRVADGAGAAIKAEVWTLDAAGFGDFVAGIPAPLGIGTLRLADGSASRDFWSRPRRSKAREDVSRFGGWRGYLGSLGG